MLPNGTALPTATVQRSKMLQSMVEHAADDSSCIAPFSAAQLQQWADALEADAGAQGCLQQALAEGDWSAMLLLEQVRAAGACLLSLSSSLTESSIAL